MTTQVAADAPERALARLAAHVRTPLYREGYALMLSAGLASVLGLVYWIIAARTYAPSVVGLNAAAISAMLFLSGIAQLNLVTALTRFMPDAGRSTWRLVGWSYGISLAVSAGVTAVFLLGIQLWAPRLGFLRSSGGFVLWFVAATMLWSIFTLQDSVLTGLRRAIWVPVDNTVFALAKIALLAGFAAIFPRYGILASWTLGAVFSVVLINAVLVARLLPAHAGLRSRALRVATAREIGRFAAADYVGGLFWLASSTLIPIAVTQRLGGTANAFFTLAWVMTMPLYLASANIGNSLVVAAVSDRERLQEYSRRVFVQAARIVVPTAIAVALIAPFLLHLFGEQYADHATWVLRMLALSAIPNMVTALYLSVWRAEQRLHLLVWVRGVQCSTAIALSLALLGPYGIRGPAIAWLVVQTLVAVGLFLRWPGTFARVQSLPRRGRRLFVARNVAARLGVLAAAQRIAHRPSRRKRALLAERALPIVLARLPADVAESASTWTLQRFVRTVTDMTVAFVGPAGGRPRAVIKLPGSDGAARSLAREADVLTRLRADIRLDGRRSLLPELLAVGELDSRPYLVERHVSGVDGEQLLAAGADPAAVLTRAAAAIADIHHRTRTELVVDEERLRDWVDDPLGVVEGHAERRNASGLTAAVGRLRGEVRDALVGRSVSVGWAHGDFVPANVIFNGADATVSGVVDWELAAAPSLPTLDIVLLILSTQALTRRRELGEVVIAALAHGFGTSERELLERNGSCPAGDELPDRVLILLAWLRHTSSMLSKAPRYADNWLWTRANLEAPLAYVR